MSLFLSFPHNLLADSPKKETNQENTKNAQEAKKEQIKEEDKKKEDKAKTPPPGKVEEKKEEKKERKSMALYSVTLNEKFPDSQKTLEEAKKLILENYYTHTITEEALNFAAIQGMLRFISPPHKKNHAKLLRPKEYKKVKQHLEGKTVSVGIKTDYDPDDGSLTVSEVTPGSPADGVLQVLDRILRIDGSDLKGKSQEETNKMIAGDENTKVTFTVVRDIQVFDITITRKEFKKPNMGVYKLEDKIALIEIKVMTKDISEELKTNLDTLSKEGYHKIILDLRNNLGGLFHEGLKIADLFLPKKSVSLRIVSMKPNIQKVVSYTEKPLSPDMAILVNQNTASSCEIISAALQDHKKAKLIGTRTYGKSLIDKLFKLPNEYRIQFTTGSMYGPNGFTWFKKGLQPDIKVEQSQDDYKRLIKIDPTKRLQEDKPLLSAFNYLKNIKKN